MGNFFSAVKTFKNEIEGIPLQALPSELFCFIILGWITSLSFLYTIIRLHFKIFFEIAIRVLQEIEGISN